MSLPTDIAAYAAVTQALEPSIANILSGKHLMFQERSYYDASRVCPDLRNTLADHLAEMQPTAHEQNLCAILHVISDPATAPMRKLLGDSWERSGGFLYPAVNGFMDWHTNHNDPGDRIYLVWCEEGGKSCFFSSPDGGKTVEEHIEPAGWSVNVFTLGDATKPFWHAISSGGTNRISFGFRRKPKISHNILLQGGSLLAGDS